MKTHSQTVVPFMLILALAACSAVSDDVDWVDYGEDPMQNPQYAADMTAAAAPGAAHAALAERVGSWTVAGKMWMAPGADAAPMNATANIRAMLGDRYIVEEFSSDFMGMPFEGQLITGYDNLVGRYWSIWFDNMSTGHFVSYGKETRPGHVEFHGRAYDILTPKGRPTRMTTTDNGDGTHTMKMFDSRAGTGEFQVMELRYARR